MRLENYLQQDPKLVEVNELARQLYAQAGLALHNHDHALWDTERIIIISEAEGHRNISLPIAAGLMHDSGVSRGHYRDHAANGGKNVREYLPGIGFKPEDTEEIAVAVEQHNSWEHTSDTSRFLYDGDTLNKSGLHGIRQLKLVRKELDLPLTGMKERLLPYYERLAEKGYYTDTAKEIDRQMGDSRYRGLELMLEYWRKVDELLRQGTLSEEEIIKKVKVMLGIENES